MEYWLAAIIYLMGSLFMTMHFEPSDDGPATRYLFFVFFWPFMTLWFLILDFLGFGEEEEE